MIKLGALGISFEGNLHLEEHIISYPKFLIFVLISFRYKFINFLREIDEPARDSESSRISYSGILDLLQS